MANNKRYITFFIMTITLYRLRSCHVSNHLQ